MVSSANWKIGDQNYYRQFGVRRTELKEPEITKSSSAIWSAANRLLGSTRRTYCTAIAFTATSSEVEILIGSLIWN